MFSLIKPNFADARRNLHFSFGVLGIRDRTGGRDLAVDVVLFRPTGEAAYQTNDPHLEEILEADHARDPHYQDDPKAPLADSPGYEVTDINVNGIVVFLASLGAFVGVFFIFCFGMGKVINTAIIKSDGPPNKWNRTGSQPRGKREDLTFNAVMEQQQLNQMVQRPYSAPADR